MALVFIIAAFAAACGPASEEEEGPKVIYTACTLAAQGKGKCLRYMDRDIHFGKYVATKPLENDIFHVQKVRDALLEIEQLTDLGPGYFRFHEINAGLIAPITEFTDGNFRSFIQIWPDSKFNEFWDQTGPHADHNAVLAMNKANKRQFYIVLRASCFDSDSDACTQGDGELSFTTERGLRALVARQFARMLGARVVSCDDNQSHLMCADYPSDAQWSATSKERAALLINNSLEAVSNSTGFYEEFWLEE